MLVAMTDPQKQSTATPGLVPDTDGAFQQALLKVRELETENAKLYEDNRRLAAAVHMLNERHVFLSKPQAAQLHQLMYLQELVRNIETDRLRATRQHQEILSSLTNGTTSQLLVTQLQQSRVEYTHLLKEYNYLLDKHTKLKVHLSMVNPTHISSHVPPGAPVPVMANYPAAIFPQRPEIYMHGDPSRDVPPSHTPHFPLPQQVIQNTESRSFDGFAQRQTPAPIQYPVASLPTPPSSASMAAPAGPPLHSPLQPVTRHPVKPPIHIPQLPTGPRIMSAPATLSQSYHPFPQGPKPVRGPYEVVDLTKAESTPLPPHAIPRPVQSPSASMSPGSVKRSSSVLASPEVDVKRPRVEGPDQSPPDNRVTDDSLPPVQCLKSEANTADNMAQVKLPDLQASSVSSSAVVDQEGVQPTQLSENGLRPDEECVRIIFEKDAQLENGVFCDPCLSRYEAGMLSEPPDVLVNPDPDFLLKHCMTVHPTLWDDLRHRRDLTEK